MVILKSVSGMTMVYNMVDDQNRDRKHNLRWNFYGNSVSLLSRSEHHLLQFHDLLVLKYTYEGYQELSLKTK